MLEIVKAMKPKIPRDRITFKLDPTDSLTFLMAPNTLVVKEGILRFKVVVRTKEDEIYFELMSCRLIDSNADI